ncbi:hypothetical protein KQI65_14680 [bacterium]|nr:hypothetical protein [bacterium]
MNAFDRALQKGSGFHIAFSITIVLFFVGFAFVEPEQRYVAMLLVLIGLSDLGKELRIWYQARGQ